MFGFLVVDRVVFLVLLIMTTKDEDHRIIPLSYLNLGLNLGLSTRDNPGFDPGSYQFHTGLMLSVKGKTFFK